VAKAFAVVEFDSLAQVAQLAIHGVEFFRCGDVGPQQTQANVLCSDGHGAAFGVDDRQPNVSAVAGFAFDAKFRSPRAAMRL